MAVIYGPDGSRLQRPSRPAVGEVASARRDGGMHGWLGELIRPRDATLAAIGGQIATYRALLQDDQVAACWQQRTMALTSTEWEVEPASDRRADRKAAEALKAELDRIDFDRITRQMLLGVFYGLAVAEILWAPDGDRVAIADIRPRQVERFVFDVDGNLRLLTRENLRGELLPPAKFWCYTYGAEHADDPYGIGLAAALYWPVWLKRNAARMWAIALEKYAAPTVAGYHPPGADDPTIDKLLSACQAVALEQAVALPDGMRVELIEAKRSSGGDFQTFCRHWDAAVAKVILSQTMTTESGSSRSQAEVHADVRNEIIEADADLICQSFNAQVVTPWCGWNFPAAVPPRVWRVVQPPEDLAALAQRDKLLVEAGYRPTAERVAEVYGEGYERVEEGSGGLPATATDPTADLAEGDDEPITDRVDPLVGRLEEMTAPAIDQLIAQIRAAIEDAGDDLAMVSERLLAAYPELGIDGLADAIGQALVIAHADGEAQLDGKAGA